MPQPVTHHDKCRKCRSMVVAPPANIANTAATSGRSSIQAKVQRVPHRKRRIMTSSNRLSITRRSAADLRMSAAEAVVQGRPGHLPPAQRVENADDHRHSNIQTGAYEKKRLDTAMIPQVSAAKVAAISGRSDVTTKTASSEDTKERMTSSSNLLFITRLSALWPNRNEIYRPSPVVSGAFDANIGRSARSGGLNIAIAASRNRNITATAVQPQGRSRSAAMAVSPP